MTSKIVPGVWLREQQALQLAMVVPALLMKTCKAGRKIHPVPFLSTYSQGAMCSALLLAKSKKQNISLLLYIARRKAEHVAPCEYVGKNGTGCIFIFALQVFINKAGTTLRYTPSHFCTVLYCAVLHCTVLCCTVL